MNEFDLLWTDDEMQSAREESYQQGRADAIDELVAKVCTTWLFTGNSGKAYREEIKAIAEQLKEQK